MQCAIGNVMRGRRRVIVGGMHHESNTFNRIVVGREDVFVLRGDEIFGHVAGSAISGAVKSLSDSGYEVVPTLLA